MKFNRWRVVFGALLIQASLGAIYIYSIFKSALKARFPEWSATDLALPAQVLLAAGALAMIFAGRIQDKIGPKKTAIAGAMILLLGMYVAAKAQTLAQFVFGFGVLGGVGIWTAYVCPIATCVKWFPDKRGLITGLAVAGFGAGGLIFAPIASYLIANIGIMAALFYLGLIYFSAIIFGAQFLRVPPADYRPKSFVFPGVQAAFDKIIKTDYTGWEMIKTRRFWILWGSYFVGAGVGLMVIMNIVNIWQDVAKIQSSVVLAQGAFLVMLVSVLNAAGRIIWGRVSDVFGRQKTLALIFSLCGMAVALLVFLTSFWQAAGAIALVGFCFGGFLAVYPAICADDFGVKNAGGNYGLLFTAYGAGGLLGPWLGTFLGGKVNLAAAGFCFLTAFLIYRVRR